MFDQEDGGGAEELVGDYDGAEGVGCRTTGLNGVPGRGGGKEIVRRRETRMNRVGQKEQKRTYVADYVRVAEGDAERGRGVDARVHACY